MPSTKKTIIFKAETILQCRKIRNENLLNRRYELSRQAAQEYYSEYHDKERYSLGHA